MYFLRKKSFFTTLIIALFVMFSAPLKANPGGFSDEELKGFANAFVQVMSIQQQGQMQMIEKIEENDMTVERFNEIYMQSMEMPLEEIEFSSPEEKESFTAVSEEIEMIQAELEGVLINTIEEEGLSIEKYEEIIAEYQQNPELQQKIQELMQ